MASPQTRDRKIDAVENAIEFIHMALLDLESGKLNFAVVHLAVGIEILLKARLAFEGVNLVKDTQTGRSVPLKAHEVLDLCTKHALFDAGAKATFKKVAGWRNTIVHFAPSMDLFRATLVAALRPVSAVLSANELARKLDERTRSLVNELTDVLDERLDHLPVDLSPPNGENIQLTCPMCRRPAALGNGGFECEAPCSERRTGTHELQSLATRYWMKFETPVMRAKGQLLGALPCPICKEQSLIVELMKEDRAPGRQLMCLHCLAGWRRDAFVGCNHCPFIRLQSAPECIACTLNPDESDRPARRRSPGASPASRAPSSISSRG